MTALVVALCCGTVIAATWLGKSNQISPGGVITQCAVLLAFPILAAAVWRSAQAIGWWTCLILIASWFVSALVLALLARAQAILLIVHARWLVVLVMVGCTVSAWLLPLV